MPRLISPSRQDLGRLRAPLTAGELRVLDFFDCHLSDGWEIYVQPHLNGLRPDFVLLNPRVGIAVFEIKDWDLDAMRYFVRSESHALRLWCERRDGVKFWRKDNPIEKVERYKREMMDLYCPRLRIQAGENSQLYATVTAGVIMTEASTERAVDLLHPFRTQLGHDADGAKRYYPLAGSDALVGGDLGRVFPEGLRTFSKLMTSDLAADLRSWLVEPDHATAQRNPLPLDERQRMLATTRTTTGYRRVSGPAGCGKSLVVAARGAQLSAEGKDVLVVSFNITLLHYLRDLAVRYPDPRRSIADRITFLHFHDWCKRVCEEAGMAPEYRALFDAGSEDAAMAERVGVHDLFEEQIPALVELAIRRGGDGVSSYDAVLVDEGQDFNLKWWSLLRRTLRQGGEMLLTADVTQDLYSRSCKWTDASMRGAGFVGSWSRLEGCYRSPPALVPILERFAMEYLPKTDINLPTRVHGELFEQTLKLRWVQIRDSDTVDACVRAVCELNRGASAVPWSDITLLVGTHDLGLRCVEALERAPRNIHVNHVFARDRGIQKALKFGFWMGDARLKAATVHSFKGWESRALVVHIDRAGTPAERAAVYVALSRLRRSEKGSFLTVVCSAADLEAYGRTWPVFELD